jgi:hypothetical protein
MAVAAASVAAVAGGGVAVQGAIRADERPAAIIHRAEVAQLASRPAKVAVQHVARTPKRVVRRKAPRRRTVTPRRSAGAPAPAQAQAQAQAQAAVPAQQPAATTSAAPAQQPVTQAAGSGSGGGSAAGEFGFESP